MARRGRFLEAHNERLRDAKVLLKARRWIGAVYMGGYAIECLLKALIIARRRLGFLTQEFWHHDLEQLVFQAGLTDELKPMREISEHLALLYDSWSITLRYGHERVGQGQAEKFMASVTKVREWLQNRPPYKR